MDTDWGTGYCQRVQVTNTGNSRNTWTVQVPMKGKVENLWNAQWSQNGTTLTASGMDWNKTLAPSGMPNSTAEFGFCGSY
ncbi:hypothetical protein AF72_07780 [Xylella taiwanensis]|uniref:CBM2 domain-containing protein n=2 Tax=Xylella taiwanensis TaxID=1444770 RepID=Z9JJC6_9GAMM|nr:cellulose binding domain-containing protein [Xylella taiwanensis]EWS78053.1 hypothetical protein AF72_07780 [Xylella taiwanensis]